MTEYWRIDQRGERRGPEPLEQIVLLIQSGALEPSTLVWASGMAGWRAAMEVEELRPHFGPPPPPPGVGAAGWPAAPAWPAPAGAVGGRLLPEFPVWGLFWRSLVVGLGGSLIIPWPWATAWFHRWTAERVRLPNGVRLGFSGTGGELALPYFGLIAAAFAMAAAGVAVHLAAPIFGLLILLGSLAFGLWFTRWICAHTTSEDGSLRIGFKGSYLGFLGWIVLIEISFITVIGWAWAVAGMLRWMARNVEGSHRFAFEGSGWGILWRTIVGGLACSLVVPIPWIARWLASWYVSNVTVA